jgi:hypothetical protein
MEEIEDSALWSMAAIATLRLGTIEGAGKIGNFPTVILTVGAEPLGTDLQGALRTTKPSGQYLFQLAPWVAEDLAKQLAAAVAQMPPYPKPGN